MQIPALVLESSKVLYSQEKLLQPSLSKEANELLL
jgi:hypothetical protein